MPNANNVEVIYPGVIVEAAGKVPAVGITNDKKHRARCVQNVAADDYAEVVRGESHGA